MSGYEIESIISHARDDLEKAYKDLFHIDERLEEASECSFAPTELVEAENELSYLLMVLSRVKRKLKEAESKIF